MTRRRCKNCTAMLNTQQPEWTPRHIGLIRHLRLLRKNYFHFYSYILNELFRVCIFFTVYHAALILHMQHHLSIQLSKNTAKWNCVSLSSLQFLAYVSACIISRHLLDIFSVIFPESLRKAVFFQVEEYKQHKEGTWPR